MLAKVDGGGRVEVDVGGAGALAPVVAGNANDGCQGTEHADRSRDCSEALLPGGHAAALLLEAEQRGFDPMHGL